MTSKTQRGKSKNSITFRKDSFDVLIIGRGLMRVDGHVSSDGLWGVYQAAQLSAPAKRTDPWNITHIPTGFCAGVVTKLEIAKQVCALLSVRNAAMWRFGTLGIMPTSKRKLSAARDAYIEARREVGA